MQVRCRWMARWTLQWRPPSNQVFWSSTKRLAVKWLFKKRNCASFVDAQQFQHKHYPSQWFLNPTMLISCLHCLPLHTTQNQAKRWTLTLSPSCPWSLALSLHRPSYLCQSSLPPAILAYTNYIGLGLINNACMAIQQSEGEGCTSSKKTRPTTTSIGRPARTSYRRQ